MSPLKLVGVVGACLALPAANSRPAAPLLQANRVAASDLEITGTALDIASDHVRYLSYEHLLTLPQVTLTVTDDGNFRMLPNKKIVVTGIYLDVLESSLGVDPGLDLVTAQCSDGYRSDYTPDYVHSHRPIFALKIDGLPVETWVAQTHYDDPGTYFITHADFTPSFNILAFQEMSKIPAKIVRLDFNSSQHIFDAIAPQGNNATNAQVMDGFRIAQQHCIRCHNMGSYGGTKAGKTWQTLGTYAASSPSTFERYIRNPKSVDPKSEMSPNLEFDEPTVKALQAYFQNFAPVIP